MSAKEILNQFFGYPEFRPGQLEIITAIMSGQNVLSVLPTGGGKSICYQIPAILAPAYSVVISPLIALMKDQVDSINKIENIAAFINSTLDFRESEKVLQNVAQGKIKLLYLAPEKLDNLSFIERLNAQKPNYLFVDEAHCISEWGHNFRPSYRKIKQFIDYIGIKNISAFTATATQDVRNDIVEQLGMQNTQVFVRGFERNNLRLNVIQTKRKKEILPKLLNKDSFPAIIYAATRKITEEICDYLRSVKIDAAYYHAGLTSELRRIIQDDFINDRIKVIVSTNAFGMGIDKSDIRTVIHFNLPGNIENYYQEIGRAGRDGNESNIYLLYDSRDKLIQEYFIKNSYPTKEQIAYVYNAICDYGKVALGNLSGNEIPIDNNLISYIAAQNISRGLIEASIRILEESNYITSSSEINKKHTIQFIIAPQKLSGFIKNMVNNELKDLVIILTQEYGREIFVNKTLINISHIASLLDTSVNEIIDGLTALTQSGVIEYSEPSKFPTIKLNSPRINSEELKLDFNKQKELYNNSKQKLELMLGYIINQDCRFKYILTYFGQIDNNYKCGKCDTCTGISFSNSSIEYIEEHILQTLNGIHSGLKKKDLFDILLGRSRKENYIMSSTFGSCELLSRNEISEAINNLIISGDISFDKDLIKLTSQDASAIVPNNISQNSDYENELRLFNLLRQLRSEASKKFNQPAYIICPDEVLRDIAANRPKSYSDLLGIRGFNQRMYNKIGDDILHLIKESTDTDSLNQMLKEKNIPQNVLQVLELVQKKYSLEDVSSLTKLPESVISVQIETLLDLLPNLEIDSLFDAGELKIINEKINLGITDLKLLRIELNEKMSYAKLRIALAKSKSKNN